MQILDNHQRVLAEVRVRLEPDSRLIRLTHADHPDALLRYYFGRGGRRVTLAFGDKGLTGSLDTRWQGGARRWFVTADEVYWRSDDGRPPPAEEEESWRAQLPAS